VIPHFESVPATFDPLVLDDSDWSEIAWMSRVDVAIVQEVLTAKAREAKDEARRLDVLEWGSGRSTVGLSAFVKTLGIECRWLTLEHDRAYFLDQAWPLLQASDLPARFTFAESWSTQAPTDQSGIHAVVFDYGLLQPFQPEFAADRAVDLSDYVSFPTRVGRSFDVVFVDGRARRRCLVAAATLGKPRAVTILHDAHRAYYHCAFDEFAVQRRVGESLWVGTQWGAHSDGLDYVELVTTLPKERASGTRGPDHQNRD
jgi:hypothetical protein